MPPTTLNSEEPDKGYVDSPRYFMCCHALFLPARIKIAANNCDEHDDPSSQKMACLKDL